ncbi:MAG: GntR family transcriptional regulator [Ilumatobacteraceae bacterium]|nr:MAG: GntR family transcriptional regulator [Actinomycetota bacterium]
MREIRYQQIAREVRERVVDGAYGAGGVLPSEAELGVEFGVSRVTVRRALELLREEGLVDARQGFGWFVAREPLRQSLGHLATIEGQLAESGIRPERRILEFAFVPATRAVAAVLGAEQVLRVKRVNLADGEPFAVVTVWCPAERGQHLSRSDVERSPFYELLDVVLAGATQTIAADAATAADARLLGVPSGSPVLRCRRVTTDTTGRAVLLSEHVFPGHRTEFVVDLPHAEPSIAPTGLRLVDER